MRLRVGTVLNVSSRRSMSLLKEHLRDIGLGVLGTFFMHSSLKSCLSISREVSNYLRELGWSVDSAKGFGEMHGHYNLCVLTDTGWVGVDPTFMQFECKYEVYDEDLNDDEMVSSLSKMLDYFESIIEDGLNAFHIKSLTSKHYTSGIYELPPPYVNSRTWVDYYSKLKSYALNALDGKGRNVPFYARVLRYRRGLTDSI